VVSCIPGDGDDNVPDALDGWGNDSTAAERGLSLDANTLRQQHVERVYLAGLAEGDFFGEFSFLARQPRSATVEAVTDGVLLVVERGRLDALLQQDTSFVGPLLSFYKERVVELMMAKSPIFSLLAPKDRRALLDASTLLPVDDGQMLVEEGSQSDTFYFIKAGEMEVFRRDHGGHTVFINKLGSGQFFGEIAALRGTPRSVSVRAIGPGSVFAIDGKALQAIVARQPRLAVMLQAVIASRSAEADARTQEFRQILFST
jgi:CRP-like cAMP-binding protein